MENSLVVLHLNRGIMMEGFMSMMAGFFGAGHATTTYSNNIGLIGMTRVFK